MASKKGEPVGSTLAGWLAAAELAAPNETTTNTNTTATTTTDNRAGYVRARLMAPIGAVVAPDLVACECAPRAPPLFASELSIGRRRRNDTPTRPRHTSHSGGAETPAVAPTARRGHMSVPREPRPIRPDKQTSWPPTPPTPTPPPIRPEQPQASAKSGRLSCQASSPNNRETHSKGRQWRPIIIITIVVSAMKDATTTPTTSADDGRASPTASYVGDLIN
jgi:hypothetical protein